MKLQHILRIFILSMSVVGFLFFGNNSQVFAADPLLCSGSVTCCNAEQTVNTPSGCIATCTPLQESAGICTRCTGTATECTWIQTYDCTGQWQGQVCNLGSNYCKEYTISGTCYWSVNPAAASPGPPQPPGPGGPSGDSCFVTNSGNCSQQCGGGTKQDTYHCDRSDGSWYQYVTSSYSCNTQPCCTTTWGSCSAPVCGTCVRTGTKKCGSSTYTVYDTQANCPAYCLTNFCDGKPACGQNSACGACGTGDSGASGVPVITSPANAANILLDGSNQVTITWTAATKAEKYEVRIYPNKPGIVVCTDPLSHCDTNVTGTSFTHTLPLSSYPTWTFMIRSVNTTCIAAGTASAWRTITFNPQKAFTGNLFIDDGSTSTLNVGTGKCEQAGAPVPAPDTVLATMNINRPSAANIATNRSGNVFTANVPYISNLRANLVRQSNVECKCPTGCSYNSLGGDFNYNFYVGDATANPWWQTQNGLAFAGAATGDAIVSRIPDACSASGTYTADALYVGSQYPSNLIDGDNNTYWYNTAAAPALIHSSLDFGSPIQLAGIKIRWYKPSGASYFFRIRGYNRDAGGNPIYITPMFYTSPAYFSPGNGAEITYNFAANIPPARYYQLLINTVSGVAGLYEATPIYKSSCAPSFSLKDTANTTNSSGIAITGGGDIDVAAPDSTRYNNLRAETTGTSIRAIGSEYKGTREDYDYFYNKYSMGAAPTTDFTGALPAGNPGNGRAYFRSGNTTLTGAWAVPANRSLVIFVDGNLTIDTSITVARGGFLAFVVSGDITFANTLGHALPTTTTSNVQGVFIGDRIILQGGRAGGDLKFVGEGTFVGWSDIQMLRSYADPAANTTDPTEVFRYRPDFLFNTPDRMKQPNIVWQETN